MMSWLQLEFYSFYKQPENRIKYVKQFFLDISQKVVQDSEEGNKWALW